MRIDHLIIYFICCFTFFSQAEARIYVMGYPKSGNNLLCYSLANILNKAVLINPEHSKKLKVIILPNILDNSPVKDLENPIEDFIKDALFFEHHSCGLRLYKADQKKDYLVVIVRDYHECFVRNKIQGIHEMTFRSEDVMEVIKNMLPLEYIKNCYNSQSIHFINILRCFDEWNPETRVLIYYEDLLTDFENTIESCIKKLNIKDHFLKEFLVKKKERLEESRTNYQFGKAVSGEDVKYHQKKWLTPEIAIQMDCKLEQNFPYYWQKYLKRYEIIPK